MTANRMAQKPLTGMPQSKVRSVVTARPSQQEIKETLKKASQVKKSQDGRLFY